MNLFLPRVREILQAGRDKMKASFVRLAMSFVVYLIVFLIILMVPLMYQNSSFRLFEGLSKGMVVGGTTQNVTTKLLTSVTKNGFGNGGGVQNITHDSSGGRDNSGNIFKRSKSGSLTNDSPQHIGIPHDKDKLLDGLLVSGFDESSCISRLQSHLYRKASPHKPSPYLISKLRNYEEIHRRCGPNSKAFNRDMTNIAHSKNNSAATTMCKYIIWSPANGLGNQIISMASTFLYAVLTNRVLLVKFGKDKHGLFCEPFLNSTWLLPENSPFWNDKQHVKTFQSMVDKGIIMGNISKEDFPLPMPSVLHVDLRYSPRFTERYFHCDHSQEDHLNKVPLLIFKSGQYFVPSLFMTPIFNKELNKMFPEIDTVFHHLGRYLFHPSNEVWGLISNFYQTHLAKADERIGLQIRVFKPSAPQEAFMNQVLNCTIHNKILPQLGGMQLQTSMSSSSAKKHTVKKVVLVASLSPEYGENLRTMYLNKPTVTGEVIEVYQPSHEKRQRFDNNNQNMKAWAEMYLLSLSDVLVTTYQSTFGYVAKGLGNSRAWLLYKPINNETPFPACEREFLLEPCYHAPPLHYCNGKPIEDFTSSFPYIIHCKDCKDYPGVKLSNGSIYM